MNYFSVNTFTGSRFIVDVKNLLVLVLIMFMYLYQNLSTCSALAHYAQKWSYYAMLLCSKNHIIMLPSPGHYAHIMLT